MPNVHTWWEHLPKERFWLGIDSAGAAEGLAAPSTEGHRQRRDLPSLIRHIRSGETVFHYDTVAQAITGWAVASGKVRQRGFVRRNSQETAVLQPPRWVPSLVMGLGPTTSIEPSVTLAHIAQVQWTLFPVLREFEDRVGDPLYYPFTIEGPGLATLQSGHVFKLPRALVEAIPSLRAAQAVSASE